MLIYVTGIKGGVGKSLVSALCIDAFIFDNPVIVDTDIGNPDVYRICTLRKDGVFENKDRVRAVIQEIGESSDCEQFLNFLGQNLDKTIIVNSGPGNLKALQRNGKFLSKLHEEGIFDVISLFVLDTSLASVNLLEQFLELVKTKICVVKNRGSDGKDDFKVFQNSRMANEGIRQMELGSAQKFIQDGLFIDQLLFSEISQQSYGYCQQTKAWLAINRARIREAVKTSQVFAGEWNGKERM